MSRVGTNLRTRLAAAGGAALLVPIGLGTKIYAGPGADVVRASVGGALYVAFFCLAALVVWPRARPWVVSASVLGATCLVEVLQLWHPAWLEAIRATTPGGLLLGSAFGWEDFPWYGVGALLGLGALLAAQRLGGARRQAP